MIISNVDSWGAEPAKVCFEDHLISTSVESQWRADTRIILLAVKEDVQKKTANQRLNGRILHKYDVILK